MGLVSPPICDGDTHIIQKRRVESGWVNQFNKWVEIGSYWVEFRTATRAGRAHF